MLLIMKISFLINCEFFSAEQNLFISMHEACILSIYVVLKIYFSVGFL